MIKNNKNPVGRPIEKTPETVNKLEQAASLDCSISELCLYADISKQTYYNWINKDKKLLDRLTALRNKPLLKARQSIIKGLDIPDFAMKYMERKCPDEFSPKQKIEHSGEIKNINLTGINKDDLVKLSKLYGHNETDAGTEK